MRIGRHSLHAIDCLLGLRRLDSSSVDAIVTDPPYGLGDPPDAAEMLRAWLSGDVFDPGGAGFMGEEWDAFVPPPATFRELLRVARPGAHALVFAGSRTFDLMALSLRLAGWEIRDGLSYLHGEGFPKNRSALKPAWEPIVLARKPLDGTLDENLRAHGCGALNVDATRLPTTETLGRARGGWQSGGYVGGRTLGWDSRGVTKEGGRWPANVLLAHSEDCSEDCAPECPVALLDEQSGVGAARFFYCARASRAEREEGLDALPEQDNGRRNTHPTVKPLDLLRHLIRLVCPEGGVVLDPFVGSGSTMVAAEREGRASIGFERESAFAEIASHRLAHWVRVSARERLAARSSRPRPPSVRK